jgi:hypothetical protein
MQDISGDPDHLGVIEIMGAQKDWNLKADRRPLNLKRDTHTFLRPDTRGYLDACHGNSKFRHSRHSPEESRFRAQNDFVIRVPIFTSGESRFIGG